MPCAAEGAACSAHLEGKIGRGKAIGFKPMMESDQTLVASAIIKLRVYQFKTASTTVPKSLKHFT